MNSHGDRLRLAPPSAKCDLGIVQGALRFTAKEESPDEGLLREYSLATNHGTLASSTCSFQKNVGRATVTNNEKGKL